MRRLKNIEIKRDKKYSDGLLIEDEYLVSITYYNAIGDGESMYWQHLYCSPEEFKLLYDKIGERLEKDKE